jgi:hypothetical protein
VWKKKKNAMAKMERIAGFGGLNENPKSSMCNNYLHRVGSLALLFYMGVIFSDSKRITMKGCNYSKAHFRWGPGSKFLGTNLDSFEAKLNP